MVEGIPSSWVPSYARELSILLVDHDIKSLTYLGSMLEQYSYTVTTVLLAIDALAMLQQEKGKFKLIMASVNMPDMDNISFLRQLLRKEIPVILIAPERSVPAAIKALGEGASFYLGKPISMDDLKYIWQHVFTNKRKRAIDEHGNPNNTENQKVAKTSSKSISINKYKDLESPDTLFFHKTTTNCYGFKGKGKLVAEDENKKDSGKLSNEMSMDVSHEDNRSNESTAKENGGDYAERESIGNDLLKKKSRVVWSPKLHLKFIAAISKLGEKKVRPNHILEVMNVPGLTQRQVASHLQKFKAHVDRIFKSSERIDSEILRYHCSRFVSVSEILERSNALLLSLEYRTSRLITIPNATKSPALIEVNQDPDLTVEAFPGANKVSGVENFLRDFRDMDMELDMDALEAFYNSISSHRNNADKSLESFGELTAMAALNLSSGTMPNAENKSLADDYLVDSDAMDVTYNLDSPSTGKQPLSDFTELLNALEEEAQGREGQVTGPTHGNVDSYCQLLENVLTGGSPQ